MPDWRNRSVNSKKRKKRESKREERETVSPCPLNLTEPERPIQRRIPSNSSSATTTTYRQPSHTSDTATKSIPRRYTRSTKRISSPIPISGQDAFENWPQIYQEEGSSVTVSVCDNPERAGSFGSREVTGRQSPETSETGFRTECAIEPTTPSYSSSVHRANYQVSPDTDDDQADSAVITKLPAAYSPLSRLPIASSDTAAPEPGAWSSPPPSIPTSSPLTPPPLSQSSFWAPENPPSLHLSPPRTPQQDPHPEPPRSAYNTPTQRHHGAVAAEAVTCQKGPDSLPAGESTVRYQETEAGTVEKEEEGGLIGWKEVEEEVRRFTAESSPLTPLSSQSDRLHSPYPSVVGAAIACRLQPAPTPTISSTEFCRISPSAVDADSYPLPEGSFRPPRSIDIPTSATTASHPRAVRPARARSDLPVIASRPPSEPVTPLLLTPSVETDQFPPYEPIAENFGTSTKPQSASPLLTAHEEKVPKTPTAEPLKKDKGKKRTVKSFSSIPPRRKSARLSGLSTSVPDTAVAQPSPEHIDQPPELVALTTLTLPSLQRDPSPVRTQCSEISPSQHPPSSPLTSVSPSPEPTQQDKADRYQKNLDLYNLHLKSPTKLNRHASIPRTLRSNKRVERETSCAPLMYLGPDRYFPAPTPGEISPDCIAGGREDTDIETREVPEFTEIRTKEVSVTAPVHSPSLVTVSSLPYTSPQNSLANVSDTSDLPPPSVVPEPTPATPDITRTLSVSRPKRNRSPTPPLIVSDWGLDPEPSFPQSRAESMSAKRQRTDSHPTPNAMSPAQRAPSPSSTQSSLSPAPDSPVKKVTTPSIAPIKLKLPANDESQGGPIGEADQAKGKAESAGLMENTESVQPSKQGGTRGTKRKSTIVDSTPSTLPPEQPAPKITLKLGGKRATASAESTTPTHSPPPSAIASSLDTSGIAGPSKSGGNHKRVEKKNDQTVKRRGTRNSIRANSPILSIEGQNAIPVEGKAGENTDVPGSPALQEDITMREGNIAPDPPTPAAAQIVPAGKSRLGRTRAKRIVDSPEPETSPPGPAAVVAPSEPVPTSEPVSQPTPVPVPHQDPTPPVSAAPTPPGGTSPRVNETTQEAAAIETQGKEGSSSQPQTETKGAEKPVDEKVKGDGKKSAVGKLKKEAGVASVSTPGATTDTPKKASAPSTSTATPIPAATSASAKSAKSAKPPPTTTTPKVTPLPKKTAASAVGSSSKLGPRSSTGTPSTSTPTAAGSSKPVAAPSSLLAATLSQLKQAPSSASKQDADVKKGKKEMPKIQKVERFPVYARTAKEEEEYAASAEQRAKERARREGYRKNALNLNFARDTYKLDSFDKHNREIDLPGHMGILTSGMPTKILKQIFGQDTVPHGVKQAQEESAHAERARAEGKEVEVWEDDDDDPEWPVRRDEDWFFDWKVVKPGSQRERENKITKADNGDLAR